jgi:hypothetical protein
LYNDSQFPPKSYQHALSERAAGSCEKYQLRNRILP